MEPSLTKQPHIFLLVGDDTYSISQKVNAWRGAFEKKYGPNGAMRIDADNGASASRDTITRLQSTLRGGTLFTTKSFIVLQNTFGKNAPAELRDYLTKALPETPSDIVVILQETSVDARTIFYKSITRMVTDSKAVIETFEAPRGAALEAWIQKFLSGLGASIDQGASRLLSQSFDTSSPGNRMAQQPIDTWGLATELQKLAAYVTGRPITRDDIAKICILPTTSHLFSLGDQLVSRHTLAALATSRALLSEPGDARGILLGILGYLKSHVRGLLIILEMKRTGASDTDIAETLAWNPKRVWVVSKQTSGQTLESLRGLYRSLIDYEDAIKRNPLKVDTMWDLVLLQR